MSEQQRLSNTEELQQALNTRPEPAWDPIYQHGQHFQLDRQNGLPGVGLEVFPDHDVVRVTTRDMEALTFPTGAVPRFEDGAVVFTNGKSRLTVHNDGQVLWQRVSAATEPPAARPAVSGSTSDLPRHPSGPQKASEAVVPGRAALGKPDETGQTPRSTTAETEEERVQLTGRLGRTPTFRTTPKGTFIAKFPLAVHLEDGATKWHTILAFGPRAQKLEQKASAGEVVKGREVDVIGYSHTREQQGKNGRTRTVREVYAAVVKPR